MKTNNYLMALLAICSMVTLPILTACSDDNSEKNNYVELSLSSKSVSVEEGNTTTFNITSGNGSYSVTSSETSVATASVSNALVTVTGVSAGNAIITVTDAASKQATVSVTVTEKVVVVVDLTVENTSVTMNVGGESFIAITSGNGDYTVSSSNEGVASASISNDYVVIKGVGAGSAKITLKDKSGKEIEIDVLVVPEARGVNMGIGYGWGNQGNHAIVRVPIVRKYSKNYDFTHMSEATIECLVKFKTFLAWEDSGSGNWLNTIMGNPDYFMMRLNHYADGKVKVNGIVPDIECNSNNIEAEAWHHVAMTFKDGTVRLYLDGVLNEETKASQNYLDLTTVRNMPKKWENEETGEYYKYYDFFLGCYNQGRWLNGYMSEARLWSVARTQDQIKAHRTYVNEKDSNETKGLLGYWKLAGTGAATVLKDYSGHGFDAEILGDVYFLEENVAVDYAL